MSKILRRIPLFVAMVAVLIGLPTTFMLPIWIDYRVRIGANGLAAECGLFLTWIPIGAAAAAWFLRRGQPRISFATYCFCAIALLLLLKPLSQAWSIGRALPSRLTAAFGIAAPDRPPFSIPALWAKSPTPTTVETLEYSNSLKLDFYRAIGRSPAPCVIIVHGGGWCAGNRHEIEPFDFWLAAHGYAVAAVDYSLAPSAVWPRQRDEILSAIAYLRDHADKFGIDSARLVLLGRSAGAQLVEATAYTAHDPGIRGVVAFYGPTDLTLAWNMAQPADSFPHHLVLQQFLNGTPATAYAAFNGASGLLLASADSPPTLLIQGGLDTIVNPCHGNLLDEKLATVHVPHLLVSLPWATHAFDYINYNGPGNQLATYAVEWFLQGVAR